MTARNVYATKTAAKTAAMTAADVSGKHTTVAARRTVFVPKCGHHHGRPDRKPEER